MSSTTFSNGTVIPVDWLNEVNALLWGSASPPATPIRVNASGQVGIGGNPLGQFWIQNAASGVLITQDADGLALVGGYTQAGGTKALRVAGSAGLYLSGNGSNVNHLFVGVGGNTSLNTTDNGAKLNINGATGAWGNFWSTTANANYAQFRRNDGTTIMGYIGSGSALVNTSETDFVVRTENDLVLARGNTAGLRLTSGSAVQVNGVLEVTAASSKLGYGTGSGGTVTQATSKSTAVTLNTTTGRIIMNNAALAAGTSVSFVFNNTTISVADCVIVNVYESFNGANYSVRASVGNAYARIILTNETGGSLSDAVEINFAVIKGSTS